MIDIHEPERDFRIIFYELVEAFRQVIGAGAVKVSSMIFNKAGEDYKEIENVNIEGSGALVVFKEGTPNARREQILTEIFNNIIKAYQPITGKITKNIVNKALKSAGISVKLPLLLLK